MASEADQGDRTESPGAQQAPTLCYALHLVRDELLPLLRLEDLLSLRLVCTSARQAITHITRLCVKLRTCPDVEGALRVPGRFPALQQIHMLMGGWWEEPLCRLVVQLIQLCPQLEHLSFQYQSGKFGISIGNGTDFLAFLSNTPHRLRTLRLPRSLLTNGQCRHSEARYRSAAESAAARSSPASLELQLGPHLTSLRELDIADAYVDPQVNIKAAPATVAVFCPGTKLGELRQAPACLLMLTL